MDLKFILFVFCFLTNSHKDMVWPGNTVRFLCSDLLNILTFTEKVIQRSLEQGSSFPSCLMMKCPLNCPW